MIEIIAIILLGLPIIVLLWCIAILLVKLSWEIFCE